MVGKNTFNAAILIGIRGALVVEQLALPTSLETGQVLVRVYAAGICGAQLGEIAGAGGEDKYLPHLLGHEGGGVVEEIGAGVTHVAVGDHVVMHWRKGPGIEAEFPKYLRGDESSVGGGKVTTFNTRAVVSENRLTKIDKEVPFNIAALMGCAVTTGLGIINNDAQLKIGQSIAVIGCGGVGLIVILGASMVSAHPICALDIHNTKLEMAHRFGASDTYNLIEKPFLLPPPYDFGADVVVETTGLVANMEAAYKVTAPGGKTIFVGQPAHHQALILHEMRQHFHGKTVMDSEGGQARPSEDIPRYANLYREGKLRLDALITHRFKLEQVNKAIDTARSGQAGRVILEME